jgi:tetratricopeptide (TPR) repeat protein
MTYLMEAPMHAYPRYSAILLALALSLPAVYAQEVTDVEIEEEPAAVVDAADEAEAVELTDEEKEALRDQTAASIEDLIARMAERRNADELQKKASSAFEREEYDMAVDAYVEVLKSLESDVVDGEIPEANKKKIAEVQKMISQSYYYWARKIFNEAEKTAQIGLYDDAIEKCEEAIKVYPLSEPIMRKTIEEYKVMKASQEYKKDTSAAELIPEALNREKRISILIRQGQTLYNTKQWNKAQEKFNQVMILDPYNITAIDYLRRIYVNEAKAGERRQGAVFT